MGNTDPVTITAKQVEAMFNIRAGTLKYWRSAGLGPEYHQVGKRVLYDVAALKSWLNRHKVTPSVLAAVEDKHGTL